MKNILFATTALVATAGIASADVSLSGAATVGILDTGVAGTDAEMVQTMSATATMSGATDTGLTFGASLSIRNGDDLDLDAGDLTNSGALSDTSFGSVFVSGDFGTLTFDRAGIDNLMDDASESHDIKYAYSAGALSVTVTAAVNAASTNDGHGDDWSASVAYAAAPVTVTLKTDNEGETDTTVAYTLSDMIGLSVNYDTDGHDITGGTEAETTAKVTYANAGVTAHLALADDDDDQWEVGFGYTSGAMTFGVTVGEDGDGTKNDTDVTASYDLGGGMTINAAANEKNAFYLGTSLAF